MTILAGVFSRNPHARIPDSMCEALRISISRDAADRRIEFRDDGAFLVKVDIGAYGRAAHRRAPSGSFCVLAGEPLLTCDGVGSDERDVQLAYLHERLDDGDFRPFRHASGTFCAAYYDPRRKTGYLVTDRLGLRPIYHAAVGDFVCFASALRILESLAEVRKRMDVLSVVEMTGFGYPFAGATPYAGVAMLEPCEVLTVCGSDVGSTRYFRWDAVSPMDVSLQGARSGAFEKFRSAVRRRLRGDRTTVAYLSGGLDSRCVVAALHAEGCRLLTFNFSLANTQDQVFGARFADRIGAIHHDVPTGPEPDWSAIMGDAVRASARVREARPEHPKLAWSGEGGSVGLGHVYLSPEIVAAMRGGDMPAAVSAFLRQQKKTVKTRILHPRLARQLGGYLHGRLCRELATIRYPDPLRALYIFLILNGPRRHLEGHFNDIDRHRTELVMPFNDSDFLEYVTGLPIDACLYHRFYVEWLSQFDPVVLAVPWQAYPGHVPSPLPIGKLPDQWSASAAMLDDVARKSELLSQCAAMLADAHFPDRILRKHYLRLMYWVWKLDLANYGYALRASLTYYRYWKIAGGRVVLPALSSAAGGAAAA